MKCWTYKGGWTLSTNSGDAREISHLEQRIQDQTSLLEVASNGVIATLEQAYALLSKAGRPEEAKEIADKAEALRQYARRARLSLDAQNKCAELKLRAQRKLGQMLDGMEKNKGIRMSGKDVFGGFTAEPPNEAPNLDELGISKATSSRVQTIGRMPDQEFEKHIKETQAKEAELTTKELYKEAKRMERATQKARERAEAAEAMRGVEIPDRCRILHGDFRDILSDEMEGGVDLLFTDPPYHESALVLWSDLGEFASKHLKPGAFLLAYSGQRFLDQVFGRIGEHDLEYFWTVAVDHTHGQLRFWDRRCWNSWKPLIMWRKPGGEEDLEWFRDRLDKGEKTTKDYHEWAQPIAQAEKMVEKFCPPGGIVVDPMCGSATIPLAALLNDRKVVGVEEDRERYEAALERVRLVLGGELELERGDAA
jgi:DNA modification methylase